MISVVMPAYNAQRFLDEAVRSILAQTFRKFELVVVDDGSTDNTRAILHRYAAHDARVRIIENDHGGISSALNRGIAEARYAWIARMDADDIALPDRLARQFTAAVANPEVVVWGTYANHINAAGRVLGLSRTGPVSQEEFRRFRAAGEDCYVIHPTSMFRKEIVEKVGGYDGRFNFCEDFELFDRMAEHGPIVALPEPLLLYRIHATSISMQRFFTMRRFSDFVRARQKARLAGEALSYDEFERRSLARPAICRAAEAIHNTSGFFYRRAGLALAEGSALKCGWFLAASTAMNPAYALPRLWDQVLASRVRRMLRIGHAA